jgi:hypothetical protein
MNAGIQIANTLALTSAAGLLMFVAGAKKRRLSWRPRPIARVRLRMRRR